MTNQTGVVTMPASARSAVRYDWKKNEVQDIYQTALPELVYRAQSAHREFHPPVPLCFLAEANSIFLGEKLLTTSNPGVDEDDRLLQTLGMRPLESHAV